MGSAGNISLSRQVPVRHEVDVFVAGGGPAGVAAAVTAARQGARVFLAEDQACLGGAGTAGMVPAFMQFGDGVNFLAGGFGRELLDRLIAAGGAGDRERDFSCAIRAEVLKRVYDGMLAEAGVDFTFHTRLVAVEAEGGRVAAAVLAAKSGLFAVRARVYVDGTGDGDLAAWAGAAFEKGDASGAMMPGTLCSLWAGVDWDSPDRSRRQRERLADAFRDGVFTHQDPHLPGMWRVGRTVGGGNIGHTFGVDATDERSLTAALVWGRKSMPEYERYYREYLRGFEKMELVATGAILGVRETRRITGDYVLGIEDFRRRAVFPDEIGRYCYPVDIHPSKPDAASYAKFEEEFRRDLRYKDGESYGVPYRILTPRGLANVLVAGRCVSADRYLQGSIRVMPGCYITGQAAGATAVMSAAGGGEPDVHAVKVPELQARLARLGAHLPNFRG
jgi:hypothetical protein